MTQDQAVQWEQASRRHLLLLDWLTSLLHWALGLGMLAVNYPWVRRWWLARFGAFGLGNL